MCPDSVKHFLEPPYARDAIYMKIQILYRAILDIFAFYWSSLSTNSSKMAPKMPKNGQKVVFCPENINSETTLFYATFKVDFPNVSSDLWFSLVKWVFWANCWYFVLPQTRQIFKNWPKITFPSRKLKFCDHFIFFNF